MARKLLFGWIENFITGFKEGWKNASTFYAVSGRHEQNKVQIALELKSGIFSFATQQYIDDCKKNNLDLEKWRKFRFQTFRLHDTGYATAGMIFLLRNGMISQMV
mgnify:CR=1 FL=1